MTQAGHATHMEPVLERYRGAVNAYIRHFLTENAGAYSPMVDYHMGIRDQAGNLVDAQGYGKALRPTLCLLTADAFMGADWPQAIPGAAALEIFHNFTLIHDDIQDGDTRRHNKPTVWSIHGAMQGINAGDAAHVLSSLALSDLRRSGASAETVLAAKDLLDKTALLVIEGQVRDISFEERLDVSVADYLAMIQQKTGALIESSIMMGALLSGAGAASRQQLRAYGTQVGRAFQVADDALGIWGDPKKTGKPVGSDIVRRKKSLPVVLGLTTENGSARAAMRRVYEQKKPWLEPDDVVLVMDILDSIHARQEVETILDASYRAAVAAIEAADLGWTEADYLTLAHALAYRDR